MSVLAELQAAAESHGVPLTSFHAQKAKDYIDLLWERNARVNLTAETDVEALYLRHLADGFPAAAYLKTLLRVPSARVADLGSGGGFVGFGLKLAWPEAEVTLIEALQRKYDFLNVAVLRSGLKGLRVVKARAGKDVGGPRYDAVVERALAPLHLALHMASGLLAEGGLFVAFQSEPPELESHDLKLAMDRSGLRFLDIMTYRLPREDRDRRLVAFRKGD